MRSARRRRARAGAHPRARRRCGVGALAAIVSQGTRGGRRATQLGRCASSAARSAIAQANGGGSARRTARRRASTRERRDERAVGGGIGGGSRGQGGGVGGRAGGGVEERGTGDRRTVDPGAPITRARARQARDALQPSCEREHELVRPSGGSSTRSPTSRRRLRSSPRFARFSPILRSASTGGTGSGGGMSTSRASRPSRPPSRARW